MIKVLVVVFFFHLSLASSETSIGLVLSQVDRVNSQGPYFMQFKTWPQGVRSINRQAIGNRFYFQPGSSKHSNNIVRHDGFNLKSFPIIKQKSYSNLKQKNHSTLKHKSFPQLKQGNFLGGKQQTFQKLIRNSVYKDVSTNFKYDLHPEEKLAQVGLLD